MNIKRMQVAALATAALLLVACSPGDTADKADVESDAGDVVTVYKTEACGCCLKWVDHLQANGFAVEVVNVASTAPTRERFGVPSQLLSCHTAAIDGYWVEGHVPADLVKKLITEKPEDIRGISAPGMPAGSPGMEGPNPVEYDIVAYHADGTTSVYATREGKQTVE
jgi:hypothetical protein